MNKKECIKCEETKLLSEFALDPSLRKDGKPQRKDGRYPYCKECVMLSHRERYKKNPALVREINDRWSNKNKDKVVAYGKVQHAIKTGKLIKPKSCPVCGKETRIVAHHEHGYDGENAINVQWLCVGCHNALRIGVYRKQNVV